MPRTGAPSHLQVMLRFREGITVLLVSRAGPQGEKGKLFHIWPGHNANSSKSKKRKMNRDTSDMGWFSTPPPGDAHSGLGQSSLGLQTPTSSGSITTSPTHTNHSEITDDAEPSRSPRPCRPYESCHMPLNNVRVQRHMHIEPRLPMSGVHPLISLSLTLPQR
ncbi:hypothetical protein BGW80DRAFT_301893 [Lactifluus volemus]|nr:hypothetical protein BGW80DRAFT_301893 [Lactifluus volemus]